jgi:hypothetical protein
LLIIVHVIKRRRFRMKPLKVLMALAVVWMGVSGANAVQQGVANGKLTQSGVGEIDYSLTFSTIAPNPHVVTQQPTITATDASGVLSAYIQGASITNADAINSYLLARSAGGDVAATGLDVNGVGDASVKNYCMYGYVTNNLAYAGQYADSITGESIDLNSQSRTKATSDLNFVPALNQIGIDGVPVPTSTYAGATTAPFGTITPISYPTSIEYVEVRLKSGVNAVITADKIYQFAAAGGSQNPYANIVKSQWNEAVNDAGFTSDPDGNIFESTSATWYASSAMSVNAATNIMYNGIATLSSNAQSMGYADKNIVYSNVDTLLAGNANTPYYFTTSTSNLNGIPRSTIAAGGNTPVQPGQNELFTYSIVNAANPNGLSKALLF